MNFVNQTARIANRPSKNGWGKVDKVFSLLKTKVQSMVGATQIQAAKDTQRVIPFSVKPIR